MKKIKKIISLLVLTGITIVFAIGLIFTAEIILRITNPVASRASLIDVTLFPYKNYLVTTHPPSLVLGKSNHILEGSFSGGECSKNGINASFNSDGFRTVEFKDVPPKEPGEIRIIITGGSAAISWNIGEACTLDSNLYKLFAQHYPNLKVRIFNLGNGAWKSFQELIAMQLYGLKLQPDVIVAFDGFNDIQHAYSMPIDQPYSNIATEAFNRYQSWVTGGILELFNNLKLIIALKAPFKTLAVGMVGRTKDTFGLKQPEIAKEARPGMLGTNMEYPLDMEKIAKRNDFDPYNQKVVDFYLQNMRLMSKAADSVGAKMIYALQPTLYLKTPLTKEERNTLNSYAHSVNFVVQGYARMAIGLAELTKYEKNSYFINLSNAFIGNDSVFFGDYCHFTKEGYEIISEKIFNELKKTLALR